MIRFVNQNNLNDRSVLDGFSITAHGNEFLDTFIGYHNVTRFTAPEHPGQNRLYFFIPVLLAAMMPWSGAIVPALHRFWKERGPFKDVLTFCVVWAVFIFVFFSLSQTQLVTYIAPMIFAHRYETFRKKQMDEFAKIVKAEGQTILGWREVPIDESIIGDTAKSVRPRFLQVFIKKNPAITSQMDFERKLYIIRKQAERVIIPSSVEMGTDFYIASLSSRTIVYKGMLTSVQLRHFYLDLSDLDFTTAMALVHSRFSTNTFPSWARAHPNRYIIHNGEINTIQGNINWLNARESSSHSPFFPDMEKVFPVVDSSGSDSAMFDNCLEYLYMTGHSLPHAMVGRYDRLKQTERTTNWKADTVDLENLLFRPYTDTTVGHHFVHPQDHDIDTTLDMAKLVRMVQGIEILG